MLSTIGFMLFLKPPGYSFVSYPIPAKPEFLCEKRLMFPGICGPLLVLKQFQFRFRKKCLKLIKWYQNENPVDFTWKSRISKENLVNFFLHLSKIILRFPVSVAATFSSTVKGAGPPPQLHPCAQWPGGPDAARSGRGNAPMRRTVQSTAQVARGRGRPGDLRKTIARPRNQRRGTAIDGAKKSLLFF